MYEDFFAERLAALRTERKMSARDLSLSLGQNASYINRIENKINFPSMQAFFYICEYFGISPQDFFDHATPPPKNLKRATELLQELSPEHIDLLISLMEALPKQNKKEH